MTRRILFASLFALTGLLAASNTTLAEHRHDPHDQIRASADDLIGHTRDLYHEIRHHHRNGDGSRLLSEVLTLHRSARRMSGYAAAHSSPVTLEREMTRMEQSFHEMERLLRHLSHHHGSHRHVRELVRCIDDLVHDIHDEIHKLEDRRYFGRGGGPVYTVPASRDGSIAPREWNIGVGGMTFRLGR